MEDHYDPEKTLAQKEAEDLQRARELPSIYSNRALVRVWGGLTRISFGEQVIMPDKTAWSSAVTMTTSDALALADLIYDQFRQEQQHLQEMADYAADQAREEVLKGGR